MDGILPYLIIFLMLVFSAFFSGAEMAFNASNKMRLKKAADAGEKTAVVAYKISEKFTYALSAILIGNNLANIAASSAATIIFLNLIKNEGIASLTSTLIMTLIVLIFGEIVPKIIAKQHADRIVRIVAIPIRILTIILFSIVFVVIIIIRGLSKIWGKDKKDDEPTVSEEELSTIIDTVEKEGVIDEEKSDLLQSTLEFPETTVEEIMVPRIDMVSINIEDSPEDISEVIENSIYSRIPVYEDSIDNIIGVLFLNHYYKALIEHESINNIDLRSLLMPPCLIHKTMKLPAALNIMREKKMHLAIVIDEFGGTLGVVTIEDILEELVGDIWDETDEIVSEITQTGENTYDVSGDMNIDDFFDQIGFVPPESFSCEYSTVGGWAVEMLEADPHVGDTFDYENLFIVVVEMDEVRITKISVLINHTDEEDEDTEE